MDSSYFQLSVPNLVLAAFFLLTLAGAIVLLRSFLRWYLGLAAMEETLHRLEGRVKHLQEAFAEALEGENGAPPRGPSLPRPGEKEDRPRLPGPRG